MTLQFLQKTACCNIFTRKPSTCLTAVFKLSLLINATIRTMSSATTMRAAQFEAGGPEKLFVGEVPVPKLRVNEVLLKVYATAINRAETLQRQGKYPPIPGESDILGLEAAGTVDQLGPGASKWKVGDRVMALLPGGGNAEYVAAHENHLMPVPGNMSFSKAAAIPEVWLAAFQLLHFVDKVQSGETVLVHAGASGVGTAAIQLIRQAGATPYVTAGSMEKIRFAEEIGAAKGFNYKEGPFAPKVLETTGGSGVDLILDCVGASHWEQNTDALRNEGRWVLYGALGGINVNGPILGKILRKRLTLVGSTLKARTKEYKTELISAFSQQAMPLFASGEFRPIIDTVFSSLDQLPDAHRMMEENRNSGKIILKVREEDGAKDEL